MGLKAGLRATGILTIALVSALPTLPAKAAADRLIAAPSSPRAPSHFDEDTRLGQLFAADSLREDLLEPLDSLYRGEFVDPAVLAQLYTDTLDRRRLASARQSLSALEAIDRTRLTPERQISYDVFLRRKQEQIAWLSPEMLALTAVRPFNHFGGLHVEFPSLMAADGAFTYEDEQVYQRALMLNAAFASVLDNAVLRFRQGKASGVVETRLTVENMIAQIDALLARPVRESPFYSPVLRFPTNVPEASRIRLREEYTATISERLYPAYRRLRDFLATEYLPAARPQVGMSSMPGGETLYHQLIERETTLTLAPDEVHRLGLSEVARIQQEMEKVRRQMGFTGSLRAFFDFVRTDQGFHPRSAEELSRGFARIARAVEAQIPRFFSRVPRTPLQIQRYPDYRAKFEPGGSYTQGSADGTRPGMFYYNTYDLPSRFLSGLTTLYLHEGTPGHHFQVSLAQENPTLPNFQRFGGNNAFVEGWALYAETLGYEMGLYRDPRQHWGTLDDEMLRAMRLVVDTGLHAKGWTREHAIDYMLANSGMGRSDATAEVERYIANPAQALSYKIGSLTIQQLRRKAEGALGAAFDIREFHDQVLHSGALPLPILEAKIDNWIAAQRK